MYLNNIISKTSSVITNPWIPENLKGKVRSLKTSTHYIYGKKEEKLLGLLLTSFLHFFDRNGNITYALSLNNEGNILWEYLFKLKDEEHSLECKCLNDRKELIEIFIYKFDEQNKIVEKNCYNGEGALLWSMKDMDKKKKWEPEIECFYNEFGDIIEQCEIFPSGSKNIVSYQYQYDEHENWIKQTEYDPILKKITGIRKREIEYYDD